MGPNTKTSKAKAITKIKNKIKIAHGFVQTIGSLYYYHLWFFSYTTSKGDTSYINQNPLHSSTKIQISRSQLSFQPIHQPKKRPFSFLAKKSTRKFWGKKKMSAACRAWIVATSIGAVEALKDQGVCRWNHVLRSMQQHVKNNIRSYSQTKKISSSSVSAVSNHINRSKEEKLRKVMELSSWGPSTIRF